MLLSADPPEDKSYKNHQAVCAEYGSKTAGLCLLPLRWRIDFCAISTQLYLAWLAGRDFRDIDEFTALIGWLDENKFESVVLRSSGIHETLQDRGKYKSKILPRGFEVGDVEKAIKQIFEHARASDSSDQLALVAQEYKRAVFAGHMSNEHRVSPTINQWAYELELPHWAPPKGINSKFTTSPDPGNSLRCGNQVPHQPLRSVAHFLAERFRERCHIEWLVHERTLYIAQIDFEWPHEDSGIDPKKEIRAIPPASLNLSQAKIFRPYSVGSHTKWPKLKNLTEFDFSESKPAPRIYSFSPALLKRANADNQEQEKLLDEMKALTGNRMVVRTDCVQEGTKPFNLPRTDTVTAQAAFRWCNSTSKNLERQGIKESNYTFLFHAFLPAEASAWAYASPGNPTVIIDALWGLPDGLQVLPVDTYEVNVARSKVVQTKSTHKPKFLTELEDGSWDYQKIKSRSGRSRVLSDADKKEIAARTRLIADTLQDDAQIMWFCGIPEGYMVGRNLPWFRSREKFDPAPRLEEKYRPFAISRPEQLQKLPSEKVTLRLSPEANLIRDESFLDKVIKAAKERGLPVQLEGSILGHTYYKLHQEGIPVILSNAPKYYRTRDKQVFGKIVRDKIPESIIERGESVREARLAKSDLDIGLAGKLIEEMEEFLKAHGVADVSAELADMLEVLMGLANSSNVKWSDVVRIAKEKSEERGGFLEGRVLIETSLPRQNSPLEKQEFVTLSDLGQVESSGAHVEVPASTLMSTTRGPGVIFTFEGDSVRYRLAIKNGKLSVSKVDQRVQAEDNKQIDMFDRL